MQIGALMDVFRAITGTEGRARPRDAEAASAGDGAFARHMRGGAAAPGQPGLSGRGQGDASTSLREGGDGPQRGPAAVEPAARPPAGDGAAGAGTAEDGAASAAVALPPVARPEGAPARQDGAAPLGTDGTPAGTARRDAIAGRTAPPASEPRSTDVTPAETPQPTSVETVGAPAVGPAPNGAAAEVDMRDREPLARAQPASPGVIPAADHEAHRTRAASQHGQGDGMKESAGIRAGADPASPPEARVPPGWPGAAPGRTAPGATDGTRDGRDGPGVFPGPPRSAGADGAGRSEMADRAGLPTGPLDRAVTDGSSGAADMVRKPPARGPWIEPGTRADSPATIKGRSEQAAATSSPSPRPSLAPEPRSDLKPRDDASTRTPIPGNDVVVRRATGASNPDNGAPPAERPASPVAPAHARPVTDAATTRPPPLQQGSAEAAGALAAGPGDRLALQSGPREVDVTHVSKPARSPRLQSADTPPDALPRAPRHEDGVRHSVRGPDPSSARAAVPARESVDPAPGPAAGVGTNRTGAGHERGAFASTPPAAEAGPVRAAPAPGPAQQAKAPDAASTAPSYPMAGAPSAAAARIPPGEPLPRPARDRDGERPHGPTVDRARVGSSPPAPGATLGKAGGPTVDPSPAALPQPETRPAPDEALPDRTGGDGRATPASTLGASEPGAARSTTHPSPAMGTPQSGTAGVANQVADAVRQAAGYRSVEVALHPEELGRVRLSFSPAEAGLTVTIQADRPETLDLLRRHADLLGQDLRQQGFGSVSFEFGPQGGRDGRGGGSDASAPLPDDTPAPDGPPSAPPSPSTVTLARVGVSGGLDLRL